MLLRRLSRQRTTTAQLLVTFRRDGDLAGVVLAAIAGQRFRIVRITLQVAGTGPETDSGLTTIELSIRGRQPVDRLFASLTAIAGVTEVVALEADEAD